MESTTVQKSRQSSRRIGLFRGNDSDFFRIVASSTPMFFLMFFCVAVASVDSSAFASSDVPAITLITLVKDKKPVQWREFLNRVRMAKVLSVGAPSPIR